MLYQNLYRIEKKNKDKIQTKKKRRYVGRVCVENDRFNAICSGLSKSCVINECFNSLCIKNQQINMKCLIALPFYLLFLLHFGAALIDREDLGGVLFSFSLKR